MAIGDIKKMRNMVNQCGYNVYSDTGYSVFVSILVITSISRSSSIEGSLAKFIFEPAVSSSVCV